MLDFFEVFELFSNDGKKVMMNPLGKIGSYSLEFDQKMLMKSIERLMNPKEQLVPLGLSKDVDEGKRSL